MLLFLISIFSSVSVSAGTSKYTTIEASADEARTKVENHAANVTVFFKTTIATPQRAYETFKEELTKETDNSSQGDYMFWDLKSETPKYSYYPVIENGKVYYNYEFRIAYKYYTTNKQKEKVDEKVKSLIKSFGFTSKTSTYNKVKNIYDYVCRNVTYATDTDNDMSYTAYSALFEKKAVCQGYAQLLYKMLKEVNVPVKLIPGYANGELHGWNIVKIGRYYYNVDVTWDAENYQRGYGYKNFLKGDGFANHVRFHDYKTDSFYGIYPMAKYNYGEGKKQLSVKSIRAKFKIKKPMIKRNKGKTLILKKMGNYVKYTIQIASDYNFKNAEEITIKKTKAILRELKSKEKYYIRYRASKKIEGKTVYTRWSDRKLIEMD